MVNSNSSVEQVRQLTNKVTLAGKVAELGKLTEGTGKDGIPYLSFNGAIQVGEDPAQTTRFRVYVKSRKTDGTESKAYKSMKAFYEEAVPMTKDSVNYTYVELVGSLVDNPYVSKQGNLVEDVNYSMQTARDFTSYKAQIDLEGYLEAINDEVSGANQDYTGRKRVSIVSRDFFGNVLRLRNVVIEKEAVRKIENSAYDRGCTATFLLDLKLHKGETSQSSSGATMFDNDDSRVVTGRSYLEKVWVGADNLIDRNSDLALTPDQVSKMISIRDSKLQSIASEGYKGSSNASTSANYSRPQENERNGFMSLSDTDDEEDRPW